MMRTILFLGALASAGCAANLKAVTSGRIGCPESEIDIVEEGDGTWTAVCRGRTYYCSDSRHRIVGTVNRSGSGTDTFVASSSGGGSCTQDVSEAKTAAQSAEVARAEERRFVRSLHAPAAEAPKGAVGFLLGATPADTERVCTAAQLGWSGKGDVFACAGTPKSMGLPATTRIRLCQGTVCEIGLLNRPKPDEASGFATNFSKLVDVMKEKYGEPNTEERKVPSECRSSLAECVKNGTAYVKLQWVWSKERFVVLSMRKVDGEATIELSYKWLPAAPTQKIDDSAL
jgi:hypothetical protein